MGNGLIAQSYGGSSIFSTQKRPIYGGTHSESKLDVSCVFIASTPSGALTIAFTGWDLPLKLRY